MPQGVGLAIASAVGFTGTAATVAAVAINTALYVGLTYGSAALSRRDLKEGVQARELVVRSGSQPKMWVYGECPVGGVLVYMNQKRQDGSTDNYELWVALAHAAHEVDSIGDIYYEADRLRNGTEINWSSDFTSVTAGPWYAEGSGEHACRIWRRLGTSTQSWPTEMTGEFSELGSSHRARGYAMTFHRFLLFSRSLEVFKANQPQSIRAMVRGRRVYDMRLDSTNGGTGTHRADDPTTWAWSDNPILCAIDYCRYAWGFASDRFDWAYLADQADKCDVLVPVPPAASPQNTQKRYTCNGALSLGTSHNANLAAILETCLGRRSTASGRIRFTVGDYQTPDVTLTQADIIGEVTVRTSLPREERYNRVAGTYLSADAGFVETDFLPVESASFVTRDNGETITKVLAFEMVTDEYQAQRLAWKELQQSDQQITCEVPLRWSGMRLTPGTYVALTYAKFGWSSKVFRCLSLRIGINGVPVTAVLREDASSAWTDPAVADYTTRTAAGVIVPPAEAVPPPTSMTVQGQLEGNLVEWVNPGGEESWDYVRVYASADSAWANATLVGDRIQSAHFLHELDPQTTRFYWVRAVRNGVESLREPNSDTSDRTGTTAGVLPLPNLVPFGYADMEVVEASDFVEPGGLASYDSVRLINTSLAYLGTRCLEIEIPTGTAGGYVIFNGNHPSTLILGDRRHNIRVRPNRLYLCVASLYRNDAQGAILAVHPSLEQVASNATPQYVSALNAWEQHAWLIDATSSSRQDTSLAFFVVPDAEIVTTRTRVFVDAVMLFDITDYPRFQSLATTSFE